MSDLTERLRALSRFEHSDVSIGREAADMIEGLREVANEAELNREGIKHAHAALREARERLARVGELADVWNRRVRALLAANDNGEYVDFAVIESLELAVKELRAILDGEA